jgi:hypothetical protein
LECQEERECYKKEMEKFVGTHFVFDNLSEKRAKDFLEWKEQRQAHMIEDILKGENLENSKFS